MHPQIPPRGSRLYSIVSRLPWWAWLLIVLFVIGGISNALSSNNDSTFKTNTQPVAQAEVLSAKGTTSSNASFQEQTTPIAVPTVTSVPALNSPNPTKQLQTSTPQVTLTTGPPTRVVTPIAASSVIAPTAAILPPTAPTIKPIAVFGQGISTSINDKSEPQSPTSRYQEGSTAYFFLNFQDANPNEALTGHRQDACKNLPHLLSFKAIK